MTRSRSALAVLTVLASSLLAAPLSRAAAQAAPLRLQLAPSALLQPMAAPLALRDVIPKSREDKRLAGWILVGAGVLHVALTPVCLSEVHGRGAEVACLSATAALGSAAIVVGAYFLVEGYGAASHGPKRRARANAPPRLLVSLGQRQGLLSYRFQW